MKVFLTVVVLVASITTQQQTPPAASDAGNLVNRFKAETVFWEQFEIARSIVALHDKTVLANLNDWLSLEDRHIRGNVAFIFAALGDERGLDVIIAIIGDQSDRPVAQGVPGGNWTSAAQIRADRYYAAHLLGDLKEPRALPILIPLLHDPDVKHIVPWSLGEIGDHRADEALIGMLDDPDPSMRVLAIFALEKLGSKTALPRLRQLQADEARSNFGNTVTVAEAAKAAIAKLESKR